MSILFYHIFLWLYSLGIKLISPWNPKARRWLDGRKGIFDRIRNALGATTLPAEGAARGSTGPSSSQEAAAATGPAGNVIWMHCSSLGEFEQGRPVLEALKRQYPGSRIILTFFSPSGYEVRKNYEGADHVFYLPLDSKKHARKFIELVKPTLVLWVKYDYWYYYLVELKKKKIPVLLISGVFRPDQPFFKWYGRLHRYMLECFTYVFVQTENSQKLLARLGISENVTVGGDTRFDRVIEIAQGTERLPMIETFIGDRPVVVAGSTWQEDEEELDHFANVHKEVRFIIAPHEIGQERLLEIERLFPRSIRYSAWMKEQQNGGQQKSGPAKGSQSSYPAGNAPNILVIDNIGMLSRLYRYATVAYVGGGFGDDGVHNVLEAAVYGVPVVYGPVIEKYAEAVDLTETGGGIVIDSALEVEAVFNKLLDDPAQRRQAGEAAFNYVDSQKGATGKIIDYISAQGLLRN